MLRAWSQKHQQQVLRYTAELAGILRQFERRRIPCIPHKGPVLSQRLYGDAAARQFGDLDLLVRAADVPRARAALAELGYEPHLALSASQEKEYLRSGYEYVFGSATGRNLVEVQWQILPRFYAVDFDMPALFRRAAEAEFEGSGIPMLRNEDLLLVLCVHAAKHEWPQLAMVRDIAAAARLDLDWDWIAGEAGRLGILRIVGISLVLAQELLYGPMPAMRPYRAAGHCIPATAAVGRKNAYVPETESWTYFRRMIALRERWRDRLQFAWRLAVTPSVGEWKSVRLPDWLSPFYRGVRLLRLARRVGRGLSLTSQAPGSCVRSSAAGRE